MSLFGRAFAGAGQAAVEVANKYIDEDLAKARLQFMADIQHNNMVRADEYNNSAPRREALRGETNKDATSATMAAGTSAQAVELDRALNTSLTDATAAQKSRELLGTADAAAIAKGKVTRAESMNKPRTLSPGQQEFVGDQLQAENKRLTPQEIQQVLYQDGLKGGGADKMSEAAKLQLQDIHKKEEALDTAFNKAAFENPELEKNNNPANARYARQKEMLLTQKLRVLASEGAIDGQEDAQRAIGSKPDMRKMLAAKEQAEAIGGAYGRDFTAVMDEAISKVNDADRNAIEADIKKSPPNGGNYDISLGGSLMQRVRSERTANIDATAPKTRVQAMDDRTLKRIVGIDGHEAQEAARAEIWRRAAEAEDAVVTSMGYGGG